MKKLKIMVIIIILSFSFFLMSYFKKRNYDLTYNVKSYKVNERYIKSDNRYVVKIENNKDKYTFIINDKYNKSRKLVDKISLYKDNNETCMKIRFNKKDIIPSCKNSDNEKVSFYLVSKKLQDKTKYKVDNKNEKDKSFSYKNIDVNFLNNKKVFIWNYNGFYYMDGKNNQNIDLIKTDVYNPQLVAQIDNYLVIPNYDEGYEYTNFKIFNTNNFTLTSMNVDKNISSEAYFLGYNDKSIFIYDKKYERELEMVPSKQKYRYVDPFIYEKGKIINKTNNYLSNNKAEFIYDTIYDYKLIDNKLYQTNKYDIDNKLISNRIVKEIVKKADNEVYYISDNKLYVYSEKLGERQMLEYFELNFNYKNIIYIF